MSMCEEKIARYNKRQNTQFEETVQTSELDSNMARMLKLSPWELKKKL